MQVLESKTSWAAEREFGAILSWRGGQRSSLARTPGPVEPPKNSCPLWCPYPCFTKLEKIQGLSQRPHHPLLTTVSEMQPDYEASATLVSKERRTLILGSSPASGSFSLSV